MTLANTEDIKYPLTPHENPRRNKIFSPICKAVCINPEIANNLVFPIPLEKCVIMAYKELLSVSKYNHVTFSAKASILRNTGADSKNTIFPSIVTSKPFVSIFPRLSVSSIEKRKTASVIHNVIMGNAKDAVVLRRSNTPYSSVDKSSV